MVTPVYAAMNAVPPGQLLDSVMHHTGLVSSSPGAFSNGNNVVKSKAWSVEPPGSHLGVSVLTGSGETPQVHSCSWVQLLGHISGMLFCWQYLTVAISQSKKRLEAMVRITLVGLVHGVIPLFIQTISATGKCLFELKMQWYILGFVLSPSETRRGPNLSSDPLILSGWRLYSQCETARIWFSVDTLWHDPTWFLHDLGQLFELPVSQFPMRISGLPLPWCCQEGTRRSQEWWMLHDLAPTCAKNCSQQDTSPFLLCSSLVKPPV